MITIIITAYKEEKTIGKAIDAILNNHLENLEILVMAPDEPTLKIAQSYKNKNIRAIKDKGKGKSAALNLGVLNSKGDILVLTDGDVFVDNVSLEPLISFFKDKKIGAVSANPVSISPRKKMLGYWAYVLSSVANDRRKKASSSNRRFFCSGYLFAIRKELFPKLPEDILSEDGYISHQVYRQGYKIAYSENSKVYVKYPDNFNDWILQKKRSAGGYNQIRKLTGVEIRSFKTETKGGTGLLKYIKSPRDIIWLAILFISRIYLWLLIYKDINIKKKSHQEIWKRVESTK